MDMYASMCVCARLPFGLISYILNGSVWVTLEGFDEFRWLPGFCDGSFFIRSLLQGLKGWFSP